MAIPFFWRRHQAVAVSAGALSPRVSWSNARETGSGEWFGDGKNMRLCDGRWREKLVVAHERNIEATRWHQKMRSYVDAATTSRTSSRFRSGAILK